MHFTSSIPSIWLSSVIEDTTRYIIFATGTWAILWVALKSLLANRIIRPSSPPPKQLLTEFAFSLRSIAVYATVGVGMEFLARTGFYPLGDISAQWGPLWFVIALVLMIIGHDAYFYWAHRIMHDPRLFRHFHRRHHLSLNPSPFTAYSFAIGEALVMVMFVVLWPLVIPTPWPVIGLFMLHQIFRNTLGHSGYELMPARANGAPCALPNHPHRNRPLTTPPNNGKLKPAIQNGGTPLASILQNLSITEPTIGAANSSTMW